MASYKTFVIFGFLLVTIIIVIQSAPIENDKKITSINNKQVVSQPLVKSVQPEKTSSISTTTTTAASKVIEEKKKRSAPVNQLNDEDDYDSTEAYDDNTHVLHAKIQETPAKIHDNADKPVDTDDSRIFSDIQMTPNDLTDILRRRREIKLNDQSNQRRKRALSPYDFYDANSFYDPYADLIEEESYDRPMRSFAPLYWYPSVYERNIRSALAPSYYESSEWPRLYSNTIEDDDEIDENPSIIIDDENDYESNRYPILMPSSDALYDNFGLQQQYNSDDLPFDEDYEQNFDDDEDEQPYYSRYGPAETYF